jgi:hypothetical protein
MAVAHIIVTEWSRGLDNKSYTIQERRAVLVPVDKILKVTAVLDSEKMMFLESDGQHHASEYQSKMHLINGDTFYIYESQHDISDFLTDIKE